MIYGEPQGLREAAIGWLKMRTDDGREPLTREDIKDFRFNGEQFKLQSTQQGIRKPSGFEAALSIQTVFRSPGQERPYEDEIGEDGLFRYKWRGSDPNFPENRGLREAMRRRLPLIWFWGVAMAPARFQVIAPVYIVGEESERQQFVLATVDEEDLPDLSEYSALEVAARKYIHRLAKTRVHQPVFRSTVLMAYKNRCAVCNLAHPQLLDAAHIVDDRETNGIASVVNGLAMCKIHHAAFDRYFLGIRPDCVIEIRHDLLEEIDGPMLRHGLQELHGSSLMTIPRNKRERPRKDLLEEKYEHFQSISVDEASNRGVRN
ncbi:putative restriction endonuclease [Brevibacterium sanguinis]|uniref:Restriction endonuclease n=2 Tax=Brevibacterium TaxID=1696 RepID=A0ABX9GSZ3_9MICO|nr:MULTISPECIES: HNH endonuclease [Brevibacterium]RBP64907.1 putative restriction endonuclease [Brevibacterium sanguinis]RBP71170.1 putative restriction endonuclease [Brevibacterium celere]